MEIAILVFFIAIFGGVLFLLGLIWFIFRRIRKSGAASQNFSGGSPNYCGAHHSPPRSFTDSGNETGAVYAGSSLFANQEAENAAGWETANDNPPPNGNAYSHESRGASAAPFETSYTESGYSSYDSGSSSGSSSDSGSSSSDSGGSSSSSD